MSQLAKILGLPVKDVDAAMDEHARTMALRKAYEKWSRDDLIRAVDFLARHYEGGRGYRTGSGCGG